MGGVALHGDSCVTCLPMTSPPNGGNCTIRGATRRRHADRTLLMVQNPHHYPWCHAPSLVQDCPAGADKRRKGIAGNDKGTTRAASSQARLVADKALHPIGKIQPQRIRCNPSLTGAILPMGWLPSAAQARKHNDGRRKRTSRPTPIGGASTPAPPTPPPPTPRRRRLGPSRDQHALSLSPCFRGAFASGCSRCGPVPRCAVLKPRQVLLPPASAAIGPSNILQPSGRLGVLHH